MWEAVAGWHWLHSGWNLRITTTDTATCWGDRERERLQLLPRNERIDKASQLWRLRSLLGVGRGRGVRWECWSVSRVIIRLRLTWYSAEGVGQQGGVARASLPSHHQTHQIADQALASPSPSLTSPWTPAGPANSLEWIPVNRLDYAQVLVHLGKNIGTRSTNTKRTNSFSVRSFRVWLTD